MKTSPGAKYAHKWGSPLGKGPTDLPLKEFSKNSNRSPRYQPKRAEKTEHDGKPVHGFRPISLKPLWLAPQSRYQPNSKMIVGTPCQHWYQTCWLYIQTCVAALILQYLPVDQLFEGWKYIASVYYELPQSISLYSCLFPYGR